MRCYWFGRHTGLLAVMHGVVNFSSKAADVQQVEAHALEGLNTGGPCQSSWRLALSWPQAGVCVAGRSSQAAPLLSASRMAALSACSRRGARWPPQVQQ